MSLDLTGIGKILEVTKNDKWYNYIWKIILWLFIITYIIFLSLHIIAYANRAPYSNLFGWELNKFRPCVDTIVKRDTLVRVIRDTIHFQNGISKSKTSAKNVNNGDNRGGHVGDNIYNEPELTPNQKKDLIKLINSQKNNPELQSKVIHIVSAGYPQKITNQVIDFLKESGFEVTGPDIMLNDKTNGFKAEIGTVKYVYTDREPIEITVLKITVGSFENRLY